MDSLSYSSPTGVFMAERLPSFEEAIKLLRNAVKYSNIDNQKHLDLTLIDAQEKLGYQKALMTIQSMVLKGEKTQAEVNELLGLN